MCKKKEKENIWKHPTAFSAAKAFAETKVCVPGFSWILCNSLYNPAATFRCKSMYRQRADQTLASSLTRCWARGGRMVDTRVLRRPVCSAKISHAKEFEMLLSQSIMQVSTLLQGLRGAWMGWARHETLLRGVAPMGCGTVKQTASICLREPIPELHRLWSQSWFLVAAITNTQGCKERWKSHVQWLAGSELLTAPGLED